MRSPTVSRRLAEFVQGLSFSDLPGDIVEKTKMRILDSLATAIAARGLPVPSVALRFVNENAGQATIIGYDRRVPAIDAALVNATLINGRSQDDFLYKSHPGALTVPAALAVAEENGNSGAEVITAVVLGYDVVSRAYLGGPTMLPKFRASGVAGTVGAAATAGKLLGLDADGLVNALGCSALLASGFGAGFLAGTMDVKLNVGMACRNGVTAAALARAGATATEEAFEGEAGFYRAVAGTTDNADAATSELGERFLIEETVYKEFPVCIFVQTPMTLARRLVEQNDIRPERIERVIITAPDATYTNPGFTNVAPYATSLKARVSARFCAAATLLRKPIEEHEFYDQFDDREVLALSEKIELVLDPRRTDDRIDVSVLYDGRELTASGIEGETLFPTRDKIIAKFLRLNSERLGAGAQRIVDMVSRLEHLNNIGELTEQLRLPA